MTTSAHNYREATETAHVEVLELQAAEVERKLDEVRYNANSAGSLSIYGMLDPDSTVKLISTLFFWRRLDATREQKRPIHLNLNFVDEVEMMSMMGSQTMGTSFTDTFALYDALRWMKAAGHHITAQFTGMNELHSAIIGSVADERRISPNGWVSLRQMNFGKFRSDSSRAKNEVEFRKSLAAHGRTILAGTSKVTPEMILEKTRREKWMMSPEEVIELGLADTIATQFPPIGVVTVSPHLPVEGDTLSVRKQKAKLRKALAEAELLKLGTHLELSQSSNSNVIFLFDAIHAGTILQVQGMLQRIVAQGGERKVDIYLNTPGGSVTDGFALIDTLETFKAQGFVITMYVLGHAASMGGFVLQAASEGRRFAGKTSRILVHRISRTFEGEESEIEQQVVEMDRIEKRSMPYLAGRTNLTVEKIMEVSENRDWWMTADEAASEEHRLIDQAL